MKQTLRVNNSRILIIKNAKPSGYYFYMNLNIWGDFQICISVPLRKGSGNPLQVFSHELCQIFPNSYSAERL